MTIGDAVLPDWQDLLGALVFNGHDNHGGASVSTQQTILKPQELQSNAQPCSLQRLLYTYEEWLGAAVSARFSYQKRSICHTNFCVK